MMILSPLEKAVLAECENERSLGELQHDLFPLFPPEAVRSACGFLRRRLLLLALERGGYLRSELGGRVLREQQQKEATAARIGRPGGGLYVV